MALAERRLRNVERGLDALDTSLARPPSRWRRYAGVVLPKVVAAAVLVALWQLAVFLQLKPDYVIPAPLTVWTSFTDQLAAHHVIEAVFTSLRRAFVGFGLSMLIGTPLGLLIGRVRLVRLGIGSLVASLQSLPSVVWVPVGIIWFGLSETTVLFVVIMGATPSIAGGMVSAIDTIPPLLTRVGSAVGARGWSMYRHVIIPAALPGYIAGLKQGWSFSWRSLMAAELITYSPALGLGLGQLLDTGRVMTDMPLMFMSILVILAVGVLVDALVFGPLDRGVRRRRGLEPA